MKPAPFLSFARVSKQSFWENFDKIVVSIKKGWKHDKENRSHLGPR